MVSIVWQWKRLLLKLLLLLRVLPWPPTVTSLEPSNSNFPPATVPAPLPSSDLVPPKNSTSDTVAARLKPDSTSPPDSVAVGNGMETKTTVASVESAKEKVTLPDSGADRKPTPAEKPATRAIPDLEKTSPGAEEWSEVVAMETDLEEKDTPADDKAGGSELCFDITTLAS